MTRKSYVQINGKLYDKSLPLPEGVEYPGNPRSAVFIPDIPDFVSPIDGKVVSGRRALREHCAKHDVVPTQELKGLPSMLPKYAPTKQDREHLKQTIARQIYKG